MAGYLQYIADQLGISLWLLIVIIIWSAFWKIWALWVSARKKHFLWFIILAIVNTVGILEIIYIFVFSKLHYHRGKEKKKVVRKVKRKNRRRR